MSEWTCTKCGRRHDSSACPQPTITYIYPQPNKAVINPNNCSRFIYGQGCYGCHQHFICWPTYVTSMTLEEKP